MNTNTTINRTRVTHDTQSYVVSTIHAGAANYYETCLLGPQGRTEVLDEYGTQDAARSGHDHWVTYIGQHGTPPEQQCQYCGAIITDGADTDLTVSTQHTFTCALHPDNIDEVPR
jgi:hypothetical protein